jgi:hypothetical protein
MKIALHVGKNNNLTGQPTKESTSMDTRILEQLEACLSKKLDLAGCGLGVLEAAVKHELELLGQALLQHLVDRCDKGHKASRILCSCGGKMRFIGHRV